MDKMRYILCAMGVLFSICHVRAQDSAVVVESLKKSTNSVPVVDFWLFERFEKILFVFFFGKILISWLLLLLLLLLSLLLFVKE